MSPAAPPTPLRRLTAAASLELNRAWVYASTLPYKLRERRELEEFRRFYEELPHQRDVLYLFFSSSLLHWVGTVLRFLPESVNAVLIGSALTPAEVAWLRTSQPRPFHHIPLRVDDKTVWEFLFAVNRYNFGWLDIDCFVLEPAVFSEMTAMADDVCMSSAYSYDGHGGVRVVATHFVFVNARVRDAIRATGVEVSPCTYSYVSDREGRHVPQATTRVPTRRQLALLRDQLPLDRSGRPVPPSMIKEKFFSPVFDTLVLYQFLAKALGHRVQFVRRVSSIAGTPESYSSELVHIAAASYFRTLKQYEDYRPPHLTEADREQIVTYYRLLLQFNFLLLSKRLSGLPAEYGDLHAELRAELRRLGIPEPAVAPTMRGFLQAMGTSGDAVFDHPGWRDLWDQA